VVGEGVVAGESEEAGVGAGVDDGTDGDGVADVGDGVELGAGAPGPATK
jgi:hypothetical protein